MNAVQVPAKVQIAIAVLDGFFKQLIFINHLDSLSGCIVESKEVIDSIVEALTFLKQGDEMAAIMTALKTAALIKANLSTCTSGAPADVKALVGWFSTHFNSLQALIDASSANSHLNSQQIFKHVQQFWTNEDPTYRGK